MATGRGRVKRKSTAVVRVAGGAAGAGSDITLAKALSVDAWIRWLHSEYGKSTATTYAAGMRRFQNWLDERGLSLPAVAPPDVAEFRDELKARYAASSVSNWMSAVRRFYDWLIERGVPIANPASVVRGPRGAQARGIHKRAALSDQEVRKLFEMTGGDETAIRDRAVFGLIAYSGLREVEISRADLDHLGAREGRQVLWVHGKGAAAASRYIFLQPAAELHLGRWLAVRGETAGPLFGSLSRQNPGERISTRAVRGIWLKRKRQAGIVGKGKTLHSLRHSAITKAIHEGADLLSVQAMARHKSFDTTLGYYHEANRAKNPAEDLIKYGGEGEAGQAELRSIVLEGF